LNQTVEQWHAHRIRPTKNQNVPNGKPFLMYAMPQLFGSQDYVCKVPADKLLVAEQTCGTHVSTCDETVKDLCDNILSDIGFSVSPLQSTDNLYDVYVFLWNTIREYLS
jgi:hypothetical protein